MLFINFCENLYVKIFNLLLNLTKFLIFQGVDIKHRRLDLEFVPEGLAEQEAIGRYIMGEAVYNNNNGIGQNKSSGGASSERRS